jgi:hypothetical protein
VSSGKIRSLGVSSPLCAITSITNDISWTSEKTKFVVSEKSQVNGNIFYILLTVRPEAIVCFQPT